MKKYLKALWQFVSYVFVPQRRQKITCAIDGLSIVDCDSSIYRK